MFVNRIDFKLKMTKPPFTFKVESFSRIDTPVDKSKRNAVAIVNVVNLPDLSQWRGVNVRDAKSTGRVPQKIRESLRTNQDFLFLNRGLVLNVESWDFDNKSGDLTINMSNPEIHGLLDGGHTYEIIRDELNTLTKPQYVKLEFLTGFGEYDITSLVDARNTANQVQDKSLLNLSKAFEELKKAIKGTTYENQVAYKENENKPIDIRDLISYLFLFDIEYFNQEEQALPTKAYYSKAGCLNHFQKRQEQFRRIYPIANDIFKLWDYIHLELPRLYNASGGKFGNLTGVHKIDVEKGVDSSQKSRNKRESKNDNETSGKLTELYFIEEKSEYTIPDAMKYPILASFRAMVQVNSKTGVFEWGKEINPVEMLKGSLGQKLASLVGDSIKETRNPNKTGKSTLLWSSCYNQVENTYLKL